MLATSSLLFVFNVLSGKGILILSQQGGNEGEAYPLSSKWQLARTGK